MGQFLPTKAMSIPTLLADLKNRMRRAEHRIENLTASTSTATGAEVTYDASIPDHAAVGDVWFETDGSAVTAQYTCITAYASGDGDLSDWDAYTVDGTALASGTVGTDQMASGTVLDTATLSSGSTVEMANAVINADGTFQYSGTPASGNLVYSSTSATGTDPYGNPYGSGFHAYGPDGSDVAIVAGTVPKLTMTPASAAHLNTGPSVSSSIAGAGTAAETVELTLDSGSEAGEPSDSTQLVLYSSANDNSRTGIFLFFCGTSKILGGWAPYGTLNGAVQTFFPILATAPGTDAEEGWNTITPDTGWTVSEAPQYRLLPDGNIQFRGVCTHASFTTVGNLNLSNPLPSAYRPKTGVTSYFRPADPTVGAGAVGILTTGVIQVRGSTAYPTTQCILDGVYCPTL